MASEFLNHHILKFTHVWNGTDSAGVANSTTATHGQGVYIPKGAVVTRAWAVVTTLYTGASAPTVSIGIESATDLRAAATLSTVPSLAAAATIPFLPMGSTLTLVEAAPPTRTTIIASTDAIAAWITTTAVREVTVVVGTGTLTAGQMDIFIEYVV